MSLRHAELRHTLPGLPRALHPHNNTDLLASAVPVGPECLNWVRVLPLGPLASLTIPIDNAATRGVYSSA